MNDIIMVGPFNNDKHDEGLKNIGLMAKELLIKSGNNVESCQYCELKKIIKIKKNQIIQFHYRINPFTTFYLILLRLIKFRNRIIIFVTQPPSSYIYLTVLMRFKYIDYVYLVEEHISTIIQNDKTRRCLFKITIDEGKFFFNDKKRESLRKDLGISEEKIMVLHVGHITSGRGLRLFSDVKLSEYAIVIVSPGMFDEDDLIEELNSIDNIIIIRKYIENIGDYYSAADVYVFPFSSDNNVIGIPLSILEAMANDLSIILPESFAKRIGLVSTKRIQIINDQQMLRNALTSIVMKRDGTNSNFIKKQYSTLGNYEYLEFMKIDR